MKLFNTLTKDKQTFNSLEEGKVRLYVCGLTMYSEPHIGNWTIYIEWDVLVRTLRNSGYGVNHVQNITDVGHLTDDEDDGDDKLAEAAKKERTTAWEIAKKYIKSAEAGRKALNIIEPTHSPKATDYIDDQIKMVEELEKRGFTYEIETDGVYFDTSKLDSYGQLARLDIEGLKGGARVENVGKKNPTDFALWKFSKTSEKRDMEWDSPWGVGFPGWHLECSVMAMKLLGDQIDIHTGGIDHINVHHTNEIAQTESVTNKKMSNFWLHANHIKVDGTKMSKSLGNLYTLKDLTDRGYDLRAFRLLTLESHYRTSSNFTWKLLDTATARLARWQSMADRRWQVTDTPSETAVLKEATKRATLALEDDLDTPAALRALEEGFDYVESNGISSGTEADFLAMLDFISDYLGIDIKLPDINNSIKELIADRNKAKESGDYEKADQLRQELTQKSIGVNDTPKGPVWYRLI